MIRLYTYFRSSSAYRVRIALNLKGVAHELIPVHLVKDGGEQRQSAFLEKNPMGQIPLLEDGDFRLTQSLPIIEYLDGLGSGKKLLSEQFKTRLQQIELCEIINSGIQPIQNLKVLQYLKGELGVEPAQVEDWCRHWIVNGFEALEKRLGATAGTYSFGNEVSITDCFLVPQVFNARRFKVDMELFPIIKKVDENCRQLEAFRKAAPENQADVE